MTGARLAVVPGTRRKFFRDLVTARNIFHPRVDRALRLERGDRARWLASVRAAFERFPELARFDRRGLERGVVINNAVNRLLYRFSMRFPRAARGLGRLVPIVGAPQRFREVPHDRPIVFALMHFGPIYFAIAVAARLFSGRRTYVLHAGGETGHAVAGYFSRIGIIAKVTDPDVLRSVEREIALDPRCIVILCFDHFYGRRRRPVRFLGGQLAAPTGIGYLAASTDAVVIGGWWEWTAFGPRLAVGDAYEVNRALEASERAGDLTERLFRLLETRVAARPTQWTGWDECTNG